MLNLTWRGLFILVLLALFVVGTAQADDGVPITWQIEIRTEFSTVQVQQPTWERDARARETALATRLQARGIRLETTRARTDTGVEIVWRAHGEGTLAQFQSVIFDDLSVLGGLIGGPTTLTLQGAVRRGEQIALALETNPSTGYAWQVHSTDGVQANAAMSIHHKANMPGTPAIQTIPLDALRDGNVTLGLTYRREWEDFVPTRVLTLTAPSLAALTPLVNPRAPTITAPPALPVRAPESVATLPPTFNWATSDNYLGAPKLTPIRNQGNCGSCWAFATVAAFEGNIYIKDNVSRDLSEQFLVSCNTDNWNCEGGWWGHKYHYDTTIPNDPNPGAVYESTFPYVAYEAPCNAPYARPYRLNGWYYVAGIWQIPSVEQLKNAIYNYGPVSVAVCAGSAFQNYRNGIFSTDERTYCNGGINHAVNLVGWNDNENTWILRNSWGTGWGENGYMRIVRGISNIGYNASYVVYNGVAPPSSFKSYLPLIVRSSSTSNWVTILSDDFEGTFPGAWTLTYNSSKNAGYLWGKRACRSYAGSYSAWGVGGGTLGANLGCGSSYPNYIQTWMKYGPFSLVNTSAAELRARIWTHTESPDYPYDVLFIGASTNGTNFYGTLYYGDWNWEERVLDFANVYTLGNLLGQSNVWIAIVFDTDSSVVYTEGGYVDNVLLRKCPSGTTCLPGANVPTAGPNQFARPAQMILPH